LPGAIFTPKDAAFTMCPLCHIYLSSRYSSKSCTLTSCLVRLRNAEMIASKLPRFRLVGPPPVNR
jgi:hypothetical protein